MKCDLLIVGGGPAGLALAQLVSKQNKNITLIESEDTLGGCHKVNRVQGYFTEHGPRVYSDAYTNFKILLKDMDLDFYDLFTPYNFSITSIAKKTVWSTLNMTELFSFVVEFMKLIVNSNHGKKVTLYNFTKSRRFKKDSIEIIDRICRLTDGADINRYTLNQFLQLFNYQALTKLYQPKEPNDIGLFRIWEEKLLKMGVTIMKGTRAKKLVDRNTLATSNGLVISFNKIVFAMPPKYIQEILHDSFDKYVFSHNFNTFATNTEYITYISITFHWESRLKLPKIYGFPKSEWGIVFVDTTDYFKNQNTILSVAITIPEGVSENLKKTANQCTKQELISETFKQIFQYFELLENEWMYSKAFVYNKVYYDGSKYKSKETAYFNTGETIPFKSNVYDNIYNVGTHNGHSVYPFTSLESAVSNSIVLANDLGYKVNSIDSSWTVVGSIKVLLLLLLLFTINYIFGNKKTYPKQEYFSFFV